MHSSHAQRFKSRRLLVIGIVPSTKDNLFLAPSSHRMDLDQER